MPNIQTWGAGDGSQKMIGNAAGWKDYTAHMTANASHPTLSPSYEDIGNGLFMYNFSINNRGQLPFHIDHDILEDSYMYLHVHMGFKTQILASETVDIRLHYKGCERDSTDSFLGALTTRDLRYTATGLESLVGNTVVEVDDLQAETIPETDTILYMIIELLPTSTYTGGVYIHTGDIHYQVGRISTPNKAYPFVN